MAQVIRKASVIICTFNRAALLPKVISNLRAQAYPEDAFEIIVVDNASTDNTRQVIERSIAGAGVTVNYVVENQPGITFARNTGAQTARYPYLAYLDDDCSVGKDWLTQIMSGFELDEEVDITAGQIIVDFGEQKKPAWLGPKSERWLGAYNHPGSQPRLLDNPVYICEGNMAITRQAWEAVGGFLGMDRFSSPHIASQEILYLLEKIKRKGGKIAFVPGAIANHHTDIPTKQWLIKRAFWNGVSSGILEYILYRRTWPSIAFNVVSNTAAIFVFFTFSLFSLLRFDQASAMYHLLRTVRRIGLILSEFRLAGDWKSVRSWKLAQN